MFIRQLSLKNFRNYHDLTLEFEKGINVFTGQNGQGKTNLLEAISLLSVGRSFRTARDADMICFGKDSANVFAHTNSEKGEYRIELKLGDTVKKAVKINSMPIERLQDLFGVCNVVVFSPDDLKLIKDGPKERRLFTDREISQIKPRYYRILSEYYKVLNQRNLLLKQEDEPILLDIYTEQLAKTGFEIYKMRQEFCEKIAYTAKQIHNKISSGAEDLRIEYEANIQVSSTEEFYVVLKEAIEHDKIRKYSTRGIHKDDIAVFINDMDVRHFGSQGQKRSAAISLKLSEIQIIYEDTGEYPIVLLDDIFSELDSGRQEMLLEHVEHTQVFLTTAEPFAYQGNVYCVTSGKIQIIK